MAIGLQNRSGGRSNPSVPRRIDAGQFGSREKNRRFRLSGGKTDTNSGDLAVAFGPDRANYPVDIHEVNVSVIEHALIEITLIIEIADYSNANRIE